MLKTKCSRPDTVYYHLFAKISLEIEKWVTQIDTRVIE